ncbi:4486_t:CDS:1, partial [Ambispora gerdemannii]
LTVGEEIAEELTVVNLYSSESWQKTVSIVYRNAEMLQKQLLYHNVTWSYALQKSLSNPRKA